MKSSLVSAAVLVSLVLCTSAESRATTIIDTQPPSGGLLGSISVDASNWIAERFTLSTAVPEPASLALLLGGLVVIASTTRTGGRASVR